MSNTQYDVLVVGGGVVGLSLAWELARNQSKVCVVERGELGREASWAGAGMIPAGPTSDFWSQCDAKLQLAGLSQRLYRQWHEQLLETTGIDNGYRPCGAIYLASDEPAAEELHAKAQQRRQLGIDWQAIDAAELADLEPAIQNAPDYQAAYLVAADAQNRNPRHLRALTTACRQQGVDILTGTEVFDFDKSNSKIVAAITNAGKISAEQVCLAAGSWSGRLAEKLGLELPVRPVHGQIVLLDGPANMFRHNINVGSQYLTPRVEGRVLVGSTMKEIGYRKPILADGTRQLLNFAASISPELLSLPIAKQWSGLRPGSPDGLPFLGRMPDFENGWIASGHFRSGLQLSPATAVVMRALLQGDTPPIDISTLAVDRELAS